MDYLARLGAGRGHHAGGIGEQDRVAQLILRDAHLGVSGIDQGLSAQQRLLGLVEFRARRPAARQELLLPAEGQAGLRQHGLGRGEIGLRRAQRVLLVLRVELGDDLAGLEHVAHMNGRSIMRPSRRKARLTWSLARTWPVSETVSPSVPRSTVTVRTGRTWAAGGGFLSQAARATAIKTAVMI